MTFHLIRRARKRLQVWLLLGFFLGCPFLSNSVQAQTGAPISNASSNEIRQIRALFERLDEALQSLDSGALQYFGITNSPSTLSSVEPQNKITHIAVSPSGALVRQSYDIRGVKRENAVSEVLSRGEHTLGLTRLPGGEFAFTAQRWNGAPDVLATLSGAALEEWNATRSRVVTGPTALATAAAQNPNQSSGNVAAQRPVVLHLIAERRGGRWAVRRRLRWEGSVVNTATLRAGEKEATQSTPDAAVWLQASLNRQTTTEAGEAHFFLQNGDEGWIGLDSVWNPLARPSASEEATVTRLRTQVDGTGFLSASAHRDFGLALRRAGLFAEGADQLEMADHLQPGLVSIAHLRQAREQRSYDPSEQSALRLQKEARIGIDVDHPAYRIETLGREYQTRPTVLGALRLGIEYSKLADEATAARWLANATEMMRRGALAQAPANDVAWANVLHAHLQERQKLVSLKPPNIIRSPLFTVRSFPNDRNVLTLLAALGSAQHTVYAGFGIPMSNTEVVLWRSQSEFQRYTVQFSPQASSELVAAMTLTKLMTTRAGPLVLGEEINAFVDPRANFFGTIAHEYGHVAVRHLSRGRMVPVWFNEGIAAAVEGGYDGYLPRVREAVQRSRLLSMAELVQWNVDGERAFLAYSQSNSLIDYIVARWGHESVLEILRQIGRDTPPEQAFNNVLGLSQQALWNAWARDGIR